jgi:hypothetical protein
MRELCRRQLRHLRALGAWIKSLAEVQDLAKGDIASLAKGGY